MKKPKVSFLIPAHNEEKIIGKCLDNLINLPYENYEVIVGLDGCTDKTEEIVKKFQKKSKRIKYYKLDLRKGKPEVVDSIVKKANGEIVIINDADWIFKFERKEMFYNFLEIFYDKEIGGIAESFPVEWIKNLEKRNFWFKVVAYGNYFWIKSQKDNYLGKEKNYFYAKEPAMFLTNIFRKELYEKNKTLGDDFERTGDILNQGKKIILFDNENMPRMISIYDKINFGDLVKQKIRTSIARKQLEKRRLDFKKYQRIAGFYILKNSWKSGIKEGIYANLWLAITLIGGFFGKLKSLNTAQGWRLRAQR
jgi:glycosyltransferase involved in cell wall biosynthesis